MARTKASAKASVTKGKAATTKGKAPATKAPAATRSAPKRMAKSKALSAIDQYLESDSEAEDGEAGDDGTFGQPMSDIGSRTKRAVEVPEASDVPGFNVWKTATRLVSGSELTQVSQYNVIRSKFTQVVEVEDGDMFTLKPLVFNEGPLKGRRVLMLEPYTISKCFRFLDLPPELRKMVYDMLLVESAWPGYIDIESHKPVGKPRRPVRTGFRRRAHRGMDWNPTVGKWVGQTISNLSLLRVNKQMLSETAPVVYGQNTFKFSHMKYADIFLKTVSSNCRYLRYFQLGEYAYDVAKAPAVFTMLTAATSLRKLTIAHRNICQSIGTQYYQRYRRTTMKMFVAQCMPLLKARHEAQDEADDVVNVLDLITIGTRGCMRCSKPQLSAGICITTECGVSCQESAKHQEETVASLRGMIAEELDIELEVEL